VFPAIFGLLKNPPQNWSAALSWSSYT
jgi:hypothetical protein